MRSIFVNIVLFLAIVGLLIGSSCTSLQGSQRRAFIVVPKSKMHTLGEQAYVDLKKKNKISTDKAKRAVIFRIGRRIAQASGVNFKWEFELFDAPKTVNAFCLPGGKIGVYTGILPVAKTEAGLAAIMGHEVAHAILRHGAERMSQQLATKVGLSLASMVLGQNDQKNGLLMGAIGLGAQYGVLLPYSRKHETEADTVGLKYMARAGYNPRAAVTLWLRMAKLGGTRGPAFMSTHPDPVQRSKALEQKLKDVMSLYNKSQKQPSRPL